MEVGWRPCSSARVNIANDWFHFSLIWNETTAMKCWHCGCLKMGYEDILTLICSTNLVSTLQISKRTFNLYLIEPISKYLKCKRIFSCRFLWFIPRFWVRYCKPSIFVSNPVLTLSVAEPIESEDWKPCPHKFYIDGIFLARLCSGVNFIIFIYLRLYEHTDNLMGGYGSE